MNGKQAKYARRQANQLVFTAVTRIAQGADTPEKQEAAREQINKLPTARQLYRRVKRYYVRSPH